MGRRLKKGKIGIICGVSPNPVTNYELFRIYAEAAQVLTDDRVGQAWPEGSFSAMGIPEHP